MSVHTLAHHQRWRRSGHSNPAAERCLGDSAIELVIVVPTFCERQNIDELACRLRRVLAGIAWEAIFVDDDSPDGTAGSIRALSRKDRRVRCLQRIGRRGLSSACIEGMLASSAPIIAVMDADLQHDETILPKMLRHVREGRAELVVATRYSGGGSVGAWTAGRARISRRATDLSRLIYEHSVSDPMSGFFMLRRELLEESLHKLSSTGFKLLLDILATVKRPIAIKEVPYTFRARMHGESKLDSLVAWDFAMLMMDKLIGRRIPMRFVAFSLVGGAGIAVHMTIVTLLLRLTVLPFPAAQTCAATATMVFNYTVNNVLTYRDQRRRGMAWLRYLASFLAACTLGALANVAIAEYMVQQGAPWALASLAGITVGAVWNFAMTSRFTWGNAKPAY